VKIYNNLRRLYIITFCFFGGVVVLSSWAPQSLWHLWWISADPISTSGHVVEIVCRSRDRFLGYSYIVDGVSYQGNDDLDNDSSCRYAKIGDPVAVYYEKGAPEISYGVYPAETTGNPVRALFFHELVVLVVAMLLVPLFTYLLKADRPLARFVFVTRLWSKVTGR
jgi:hypothetical protein